MIRFVTPANQAIGAELSIFHSSMAFKATSFATCREAPLRAAGLAFLTVHMRSLIAPRQIGGNLLGLDASRSKHVQTASAIRCLLSSRLLVGHADGTSEGAAKRCRGDTRKIARETHLIPRWSVIATIIAIIRRERATHKLQSVVGVTPAFRA